MTTPSKIPPHLWVLWKLLSNAQACAVDIITISFLISIMEFLNIPMAAKKKSSISWILSVNI
jgi:hypothetical protein